MKSFHESMTEFRKQLQKGDIQAAYSGLMEYLMNLRMYFKNKYPDYFVSGSVYQGYMDMTYFSFIPESLKRKKLRIAIVFCYNTFRFEVWLTGYNKQIQTTYWKLFKESSWKKYRIPSTITGVDSILESVLIDNPDFKNLDSVTKKIEAGTLNFIQDVEDFLSQHEEKTQIPKS